MTDRIGSGRYRLEAAESRCSVPTVKHLTALPLLPPLSTTDGQASPDNLKLSSGSWRLARLLGLEATLHELGILRADRRSKAVPSCPLLWRHQQILDRISLASFDVMSTIAEIDCEEKRADHVAAGLMEVRQDKQEQGLFLALIGDALIGVVGGSLSLAGKATAASANAILGGVLATGIGGAATVFFSVEHEFIHERNHFRDIWHAEESSVLFPDSVWQYLTMPMEPEGTIREELLRRWGHEGRFGKLEPKERQGRETLYFGDGGIYGIRDLRTRAEMLDHVKSAVLRMEQDLNVLLYEVVSLGPYKTS